MGSWLSFSSSFCTSWRFDRLPHWNVMAEHFLAVFLEPLVVRRLVDAVERRAVHGHQARRHGFVGQQHELLDELVRNVVLDLLHAQHPPALVEADLGLGEIEVQGAGLETRAADLLGQGIGVVEHLLDRVRGAALEQGQHFLVIVSALGADHGGIEVGLQDLPVG